MIFQMFAWMKFCIGIGITKADNNTVVRMDLFLKYLMFNMFHRLSEKNQGIVENSDKKWLEPNSVIFVDQGVEKPAETYKHG